MSSGNLVSVIYAPETVYGVEDSPLSGVTAETARFTSEGLSGTPATTESQNIRTDRMSAGQVITGLEVGGNVDYELASGAFFSDWFEAAMFSDWVPAATLAAETVTLTPDGGDDQQALLEIAGDFSTISLAAGDVVQLVPVTGSPVTVQVISVDSATEATVATKRGEAAIVAATMDVSIPEHLTIGQEYKSFTIGKGYTDVIHDPGTDVHGQTYPGSLVNAFSVDASYGEIVTGTYETLGNGYILEDAGTYEQRIEAAGGTVNPAGTELPLNASIDFPLFTITDSGNLAATDFCVESLNVGYNNNLDPQNCIGKAAPTGYTLGTAAIDVTLSAYLSDTSYDSLMSKKLSMEKLGITINAINSFGGWSFRLTGVQLSFPDPSSEGRDTQTMIEASGTGAVGENGESALYIYKLVGDQ